MTQTLTPAEIVEREELLAQFNEGAAPITEDQLELVKRYRELSRKKKEIDAEQAAIKELLLAEMDALGVNKLTRNGVTEVEDIHFLAEDWDKRAILLAFPQAAAFIKKVARTRFDPKKD